MKFFIVFSILLISCKSQKKEFTTGVFYLDFYNEETPDETLWTHGQQIKVSSNEFVDILSFKKNDSKNPIYKKSYNSEGMPLSYLNGPDFTTKKGTLFFTEHVKLSFKGKDTIVPFRQEIFIDPTVLWFWKINPEKGKTITVKSVVKNFITNTIDLSETYYTYKGLDKLEINNSIGLYHKVHSYWGQKEDNGYDESWYNDQGVLVKQIHHVQGHGKRIAKLSKILASKKNNGT